MKRAIFFLAVLLLVGIVACGQPPEQEQSSVLDNAVATSLAFNTMHMDISGTVELTGKGLTGKTFLTGVGRSIVDRQLSSVSVTTRSPEGAFSGLSFDGDMHVIMDGTMMYWKWPMMTSVLEGEAEWVSFDLMEVGQEMGMDLSTVGLGTTDVTQGLDYLVGAVDVKELGTEEIRDELTTHYSFVIDLEAYAADHPDAQSTVEKLIDLMGLATYPGDVWIADDGTIRKLSYVMDMKRMDGVEGRMKNLTVMELYDYGAPVKIRIPDPDDVMSMEELQEFQTQV